MTMMLIIIMTVAKTKSVTTKQRVATATITKQHPSNGEVGSCGASDFESEFLHKKRK
jgi:methionine-rich copper-binding protein CopC